MSLCNGRRLVLAAAFHQLLIVLDEPFIVLHHLLGIGGSADLSRALPAHGNYLCLREFPDNPVKIRQGLAVAGLFHQHRTTQGQGIRHAGVILEGFDEIIQRRKRIVGISLCRTPGFFVHGISAHGFGQLLNVECLKLARSRCGIVQHHSVCIHEPHQINAGQSCCDTTGNGIGIEIFLRKQEKIGSFHLLGTYDATVSGICGQRRSGQGILHHAEPLHGRSILLNFHVGLSHNQGTASLFFLVFQRGIVLTDSIDHLAILFLLVESEHGLHLPLGGIFFHAG